MRINFDSIDRKNKYLIKDKSRNSRIIAYASGIRKMFRLDTINNNQAFVENKYDLNTLWYQRFGHLSIGYSLNLSKNDMVRGIPSL